MAKQFVSNPGGYVMGADSGHKGKDYGVKIKTSRNREAEGKMKSSAGKPKVEKFGK